MNTYMIDRLPMTLNLGKQTEEGVMELRFDCTAWLDKWPDIQLSAWHTRPGEGASYPARTRMEGATLVWEVGLADTAVHGIGYVEILGIAKGRRKLSVTARTMIASTTTMETTEPPEAAKPWVDSVLSAAKKVEDASAHAPMIGDNGTWLMWDAETESYRDSGITAQGKDGAPGKDGADGKDAVVDDTLSQAGQAADAQVTGEEIGQLKRDKAGRDDLEKYLPKDQGAVNAGRLLSVDNQGFVSVVGKMELIETIDMSGLTKIERTQEPDGTPYAFRDVVLRCKLSAGSASPNVFINNTVVTFYPANASSDKYATSRLFVWGGSIISLTVSNVNGFNLQGNCVSTPSGLFMDWSKIHTIILSGGSAGFTEGSYVEIYGVRA